MSDVYLIDVDRLKSFKKDFDNEHKSYNNKAYNTFSSGYIKKCSNTQVRKMASELQKMYDKITDGYKNIDNWWSLYNSDVQNLESKLSGGSSSLSAPVQRGTSTLSKLEDLNVDISGTFSLTSGDVDVIPHAKHIPQEQGVEVNPISKNFKENFLDGSAKVVSHIGAVSTGIVEGMVKFGENVFDTAATVGSVFYGAETRKIVKEYVKEDWTGNKFKHAYDIYKPEIGKTAVKYEKSAGNIAGNVMTSILTTAGAGTIVGAATKGSAAVVSSATSSGSVLSGIKGLINKVAPKTIISLTGGVPGIGRRAEQAWQEGASYSKGVTAGAIQGVWDSLQFGIGSKINDLKLFGTGAKYLNVADTAKTKFLNGVSHVFADGLDNSLEAVAAPTIDLVYKTNGSSFAKNWTSAWNKNGGFTNLGTQFVIGAGGSAVGEIGQSLSARGSLFDSGSIVAKDKVSSAHNDNFEYKNLDDLINAVSEGKLTKTDAINYANKVTSEIDSNLPKSQRNAILKEFHPDNVESRLNSMDIVNNSNISEAADKSVTKNTNVVDAKDKFKPQTIGDKARDAIDRFANDNAGSFDLGAKIKNPFKRKTKVKTDIDTHIPSKDRVIYVNDEGFHVGSEGGSSKVSFENQNLSTEQINSVKDINNKIHKYKTTSSIDDSAFDAMESDLDKSFSRLSSKTSDADLKTIFATDKEARDYVISNLNPNGHTRYSYDRLTNSAIESLDNKTLSDIVDGNYSHSISGDVRDKAIKEYYKRDYTDASPLHKSIADGDISVRDSRNATSLDYNMGNGTISEADIHTRMNELNELDDKSLKVIMDNNPNIKEYALSEETNTSRLYRIAAGGGTTDAIFDTPKDVKTKTVSSNPNDTKVSTDVVSDAPSKVDVATTPKIKYTDEQISNYLKDKIYVVLNGKKRLSPLTKFSMEKFKGITKGNVVDLDSASGNDRYRYIRDMFDCSTTEFGLDTLDDLNPFMSDDFKEFRDTMNRRSHSVGSRVEFYEENSNYSGSEKAMTNYVDELLDGYDHYVKEDLGIVDNTNSKVLGIEDKHKGLAPNNKEVNTPDVINLPGEERIGLPDKQKTGAVNDNVKTLSLDEINKALDDNLNDGLINADEKKQILDVINDKGLMDVRKAPLSDDPKRRAIEEKVINNQPLTLGEQVRYGGRDHIIKTIGDYKCRDDYAYRAIKGKVVLKSILNSGYIGLGTNGHMEVDWFLGGGSHRYGNIIIETPCYPEKFKFADTPYGNDLTDTPLARHIHSFGDKEHAVKVDDITNIFIFTGKDEGYVRITQDDIKTGKAGKIIDDIFLKKQSNNGILDNIYSDYSDGKITLERLSKSVKKIESIISNDPNSLFVKISTNKSSRFLISQMDSYYDSDSAGLKKLLTDNDDVRKFVLNHTDVNKRSVSDTYKLASQIETEKLNAVNSKKNSVLGIQDKHKGLAPNNKEVNTPDVINLPGEERIGLPDKQKLNVVDDSSKVKVTEINDGDPLKKADEKLSDMAENLPGGHSSSKTKNNDIVNSNVDIFDHDGFKKSSETDDISDFLFENEIYDSNGKKLGPFSDVDKNTKLYDANGNEVANPLNKIKQNIQELTALDLFTNTETAKETLKSRNYEELDLYEKSIVDDKLSLDDAKKLKKLDTIIADPNSNKLRYSVNSFFLKSLSDDTLDYIMKNDLPLANKVCNTRFDLGNKVYASAIAYSDDVNGGILSNKYYDIIQKEPEDIDSYDVTILKKYFQDEPSNSYLKAFVDGKISLKDAISLKNSIGIYDMTGSNELRDLVKEFDSKISFLNSYDDETINYLMKCNSKLADIVYKAYSPYGKNLNENVLNDLLPYAADSTLKYKVISIFYTEDYPASFHEILNEYVNRKSVILDDLLEKYKNGSISYDDLLAAKKIEKKLKFHSNYNAEDAANIINSLDDETLKNVISNSNVIRGNIVDGNIKGISRRIRKYAKEIEKNIKYGSYEGMFELNRSSSGEYGTDQGMFRDYNSSFDLQSERGVEIVNKLVNMGYSKKESIKILKELDSTGVCTYASSCDAIFAQFASNPKLFKEKFVFDLYKFDSDGTQRFNSEELISDMFLWANDKKNGGRILSNGKIVDFDNNNSLNTKYQIYMNDSELKNYLSSKGIECDMEYFSGDYTSSTNLRDDINDALLSGKKIRMGISNSKEANIRLKLVGGDLCYSTESFPENSGHSIFVLGTNSEGVIVSTWGDKYVLPFEDLIKNGSIWDLSYIKFK